MGFNIILQQINNINVAILISFGACSKLFPYSSGTILTGDLQKSSALKAVIANKCFHLMTNPRVRIKCWQAQKEISIHINFYANEVTPELILIKMNTKYIKLMPSHDQFIFQLLGKTKTENVQRV